MRKLTYLFILCSVAVMISCGNNKDRETNPFFTEWQTPFGMPPFDNILPEHYKPAYTQAMERHNEEIAAIIDNEQEPDFENVIVAFDGSGRLLSRVSRTFSNTIGPNSNEALRAVDKEMSPITTQHWDNIYLNEQLFDKIKAVYDKREQLDLDHNQARLLEKVYKSFVRSGANLSEADKTRLKEINEELSNIGVVFSERALNANKDFVMVIEEEDLAGLPQGSIDAAAAKAEELGEKGKYAFTLSKPSLIPFITYSDRRDLREQLYNGYLSRNNYGGDNDTRELANQIVALRTERAQLLGYRHHADFILEDRMAKSADAVYSFLDDLWKPALESAKRDLEEMKAIKVAETGSADFISSDWWYYAEKLRKNKYDFDEESVRPYLAIENVQAGIFDLCNRLYGITFRPVNVPVYHKDCRVYEVLDADNSHLGLLLMDMYQRDNKRFGAWCSSFQSRTFKNGEKIQDPIVTIVCNFTPPSGNKPALLNLDETETFFHEFGHALHNLFGLAPYSRISGTERDFVELPSQIMENWAFEPALLKRYATHYSTNAIIPDELIEKIQKSGLFNQGFMTVENLAASYLDMDIHTIENYKPLDLNDFEYNQLNVKRGLIPQIAPRYRYPYFGHIFTSSYSAGYYSYKWAEVLDKDAFEAFVETGDIFNKKVAAKFREEVLSKGGTSDGMTLFENFRGREPQREYLLYALGLKERPAAPAAPAPVVEGDADGIDL